MYATAAHPFRSSNNVIKNYEIIFKWTRKLNKEFNRTFNADIFFYFLLHAFVVLFVLKIKTTRNFILTKQKEEKLSSTLKCHTQSKRFISHFFAFYFDSCCSVRFYRILFIFDRRLEVFFVSYSVCPIKLIKLDSNWVTPRMSHDEEKKESNKTLSQLS